MKRLLLLTLTLAAGSVFAAETTSSRYVITTRQPAKTMRLRMTANSEEARRHDVRTFENFNGFAATLTAEEAAELRADGDVLTVQPVVERQASELPSKVAGNAPLFTKQVIPWGLDAIRARDVWPVTRGAKTVNVAVLDTGVDDTHPDLKHAIAGQYNVYTRENRAVDDTNHGHGTHVSGTIVAADNQIGIIGIAPESKLWAVKVLNKNGDGTDEAVALGLDWVISKKKELGGPWVVNFSLGAPRPSDVEKAGVERALAEGIIIIAAAGNRSLQAVDYPAGYEGVIAVGALNNKFEVPEFSSHGIGLVLSAPGVDLPSTVPVGRSKIAEVDDDAGTTRAFTTNGSPYATVTAPLVYCGYGRPEDFPANIAGKIAIIERGANVLFGAKSRNAKLAGAAAVILVNDDDDAHFEVSGWNLRAEVCDVIDGCKIYPEFDGYDFPLTVSMTRKDGAPLLAKAGRSVVTVSAREEDYGLLGGTSMAAPHVTGTAALLLALEPALNTAQIEFALISTTRDLEGFGWNMRSGYGAVDALTAAQWVAPSRFGIAQPIKRPAPKRRATN
jgi:subtilisin family serine protease